MPGEAYALACALLWALSSAMIKSQTHKVNITLLNALRTVPALLLYGVLLLLSGRFGDLLHLSPRVWAFLAGSTLAGLVVGDLLYFQSMKLIGLSRALPLSTTYPFFTILLAFLFLDEQIGWATVGGAVLIVAGAYLLAFPQKMPQSASPAQRANGIGIALALGAAVLWSLSTVMLRVGIAGVDATVANATRLTIMMLALIPLTLLQEKPWRIGQYGWQTLGVIFLAGIVGTGLGTFAFLVAIQRAGAARTSILSAATPLFGVPLAILLKERPGARTIAGTVLTVLGVWLTLYQPT